MIEQVYVVNQLTPGSGPATLVNQGNSNLNPAQGWVVQFTDGTNLIKAGDNANNSLRVTLVSSSVTQPVNITQIAGSAVSAAAAGIMKVGVTDSAGLALNRGSQTSANSFPVVLASDQPAIVISGAVTGNKTNNNAAPGATNVGALTAIANAAAPTYIEGNEVLLSVDLSGNQRCIAVGNVASGATDSGNPVKVGGKYNVTQPTLTDGQRGDAQIDVNGNIITDMMRLDPTNDAIALGANSSVIGASTDRRTALTNTATAVKASAGTLYGVHADNSANNANTYLHFYDVASGSVTVGTTTPKMTFLLPSLGGLDKDFVTPVSFGTAITIAITTTVTGGTAPTTAILCNTFYK